MAAVIEIRYCRACGQLERMMSSVKETTRTNVIRVWCPCDPQAMRTTELAADAPYTLDIETRKKEEGEQG